MRFRVPLLPVIIIAVSGIFILSAVQVQALTVATINDVADHSKPFQDSAFWGGRVVNAPADLYGDVIQSHTGEFDVDWMKVDYNNGILTVTLTGPYFKDGVNTSYTPGDLYISTSGWHTNGGIDPHYMADTFTQSEGWNYVVSYSNNAVYELNLNATGANALITTNAPSGYIYRADQAWVGGYGTLLGDATVTTNYNAGSSSSLSFSFDAGLIPLSDGPFGLHWAVRCGNEVLEGEVPAVPEPTTMLLLGSGLLGLGAFRRKLKA
jgi:hypothetical protein